MPTLRNKKFRKTRRKGGGKKTVKSNKSNKTNKKIVDVEAELQRIVMEINELNDGINSQIDKEMNVLVEQLEKLYPKTICHVKY